MRKHILVHCKSCPTCAKQRVQKTQFEKQIFEPGVQPMEFICIDLTGEFYPPSSKGNRYALTAVCMLTGFTFCIPHQEQDSTRGCHSLEKSYFIPVWCLQKATDRQQH